MKETKREWDYYWEGKGSISNRVFKWVIDVFRKVYFSRIVAESIGEVNGCSVLEAGCGSSQTLILLSREAQKITGIDISSYAIKLSRVNFKKGGIPSSMYTLIRGDISTMPLKNGSFDIVFNSGVVEHFETTAPIKEMMRVTRKGGKVVILVPYLYSPYAFFYQVLRKLNIVRFNQIDILFSEKKLYKLLRESGAKNIRVKHSPRSFFLYLVGIILV